MAAHLEEELDFEHLFGEFAVRSPCHSVEHLHAPASSPLFESSSRPAEVSASPKSPTFGLFSATPTAIDTPVTKDITRDPDGNFSINFDATGPKKVGLGDFDILRLVGAGAYGKVYLVSHRATETCYAMKILHKNLLMQTNSIASTRSERDILRKIRHPFFVSLHYAFQDAGRVYLVMDWMAGGPLFNHLRNATMFSEEQVRIYIAQLVLALEHLHAQKIIHRDLKPENLLLHPDGNIAITDFGFAKEMLAGERANTFCGTIEYMAPEMIKGEQYDQGADWWSVGILMYDMLTGGPPFTSPNRATLQKQICTQKFRFPRYLTTEAVSLMRGLLERDPAKRLGSSNIQAIKTHKYFSNFSWKRCLALQLLPPIIPKLDGITDASNFEPEYTKITTLSHSPDVSPLVTLSVSQEEYFKGFSYVRSPDISSPLRKP